MVSGTLALKNGYYYAVLSYQDAAGKRHQKWVSTGLPQKGNKRRAEQKLIRIRSEFEVPRVAGELTANSEAQRKELFGKVRSGQARVLIGSTQKMGAGTNVQTKLAALHHLDCPWQPSDVDRLLRTGFKEGCKNVKCIVGKSR